MWIKYLLKGEVHTVMVQLPPMPCFSYQVCFEIQLKMYNYFMIYLQSLHLSLNSMRGIPSLLTKTSLCERRRPPTLTLCNELGFLLQLLQYWPLSSLGETIHTAEGGVQLQWRFPFPLLTSNAAGKVCVYILLKLSHNMLDRWVQQWSGGTRNEVVCWLHKLSRVRDSSSLLADDKLPLVL